MLAEFKVIGTIGKVTIPEKYQGTRDCVFLSIVTNNVYNGKYYSQWLNNISVWGNRAKYIQKMAKPGQVWYLAGNFKVLVGKNKERVMFNVTTYRLVRESVDEQIDRLHKRDIGKFQADMHAYDDYEEEDLFDSLELEKIMHSKKEKKESKKKEKE